MITIRKYNLQPTAHGVARESHHPPQQLQDNPEVWTGVMKQLLGKRRRATISWTMAAPAAEPTQAGAQPRASRHTWQGRSKLQGVNAMAGGKRELGAVSITEAEPIASFIPSSQRGQRRWLTQAGFTGIWLHISSLETMSTSCKERDLGELPLAKLSSAKAFLLTSPLHYTKSGPGV